MLRDLNQAAPYGFETTQPVPKMPFPVTPAGQVHTSTSALALFDQLAPVAPAELLGDWRGQGLATGHPLDGLLEALSLIHI